MKSWLKQTADVWRLLQQLRPYLGAGRGLLVGVLTSSLVMVLFEGVGVALVTLFADDGSLDADATADLAATLLHLGVRAVDLAQQPADGGGPCVCGVRALLGIESKTEKGRLTAAGALR